MKHEINSLNTKKMLAETLITLLQKKPISKITVSEIVNLCQINRKTFYYHFTDVYALLEWHLNEEITKAMSALNPLDDFDSSIVYALDYMEQNTYLRNCIDNPIGRDKILQFLNKNLYPKAIEMVDELAQRYKKTIEEDFKMFFIKIVVNITALSIIDSIENRNSIDKERMRLYLSDILQNSINGFFQKL